MRQALKKPTVRFATSGVVRTAVRHLIYPAVSRCLLNEIRPDEASPSGVIEASAWKIHSYIVLEQELRTTGQDCSGPEMRHDHETRERLFDVVAKADLPDGDILEFGVYQGRSLLLFADRFPKRHIYGFDSFDGLPEDWWNRPKGTFQTPLPQLHRPNVTLVKGSFEQSVPRFLAEYPGTAAIVHVDCTLYRSTIACLPAVLPRCAEGTVIIFDEYYNYPDFAQHEWRAWCELRRRYRLTASCLAYDARRVAFQISDLGDLRTTR